MNRKASLIVLLALLAILSVTSGPAKGGVQPQTAALASPAPLPKPTNISCAGRESDTVLVRWKDTATDETNYRVERSIAGGAWTEVAVMTPDASGKYEAYADTGANTSSPNRRYRVRSYRSSDNSYSPYSDVCTNPRIFDSGSYRIFYGIRGLDQCPTVDGHEVCFSNVSSGGTNVYVTQLNNSSSGSAAAFSRVGFTRSATAPPGSLDMAPIGVGWCDGGGCAGSGGVGLSPELLETAFDTSTSVGDPISWLVTLHELFHYQQFRYWGLNDPAHNWVVEGQARSIQDKLCVGANRNTAECFDDIDTGFAGYVPQVRGYLGNTNWPINQYSYSAALFWTYLTEKYGTSSPTDAVEAGMNLMVRFWEESAANPGRDGITVLNSALTALGHTERFRDIWKDFAVANYAKDLSGPGVPDKYQYADMAQPGGNYGPVTLALSQNLNLGDSLVDPDETVYSWGANYYELRPASDASAIDIKITQDSAVNVYYTVLGIKGTDLSYEYNVESRHLNHTVTNTGYDRVVIIVAGLENLANYRYSINGTQPTLRIVRPTTTNVARVGNPTSPDKFHLLVEVLAADGTPLTGVNLSNFSFKVGTKSVPTSNIIAQATVMGQHWFVVRAPTQDTAGLYDLEVRYGTNLTATESQAVNYVARLDADNVLLIDRSGSMGSYGKMDAAKATARLFVDSWRTGDKIGVVSFDHNISVNMALTDWTDSPAGGSRQTAFNAINALSAAGGTNIGDALRKGWDELKASGNTNHDWALVLLSDGKEEASNPNETFDKMIGVLRTTTDKRPAVHAVAVGPDADRLRMQRIAADTGGTYQYISAPASSSGVSSAAAAADMQLELDLRYRVIATEIIGQQQFYAFRGPVADGDPYQDVLYINVEGSAAEMVLSLSWATGSWPMGPVYLKNPFGNAIAPFHTDTRHMVWRKPLPAPGTWTLEINYHQILLQDGVAPQAEWLPNYQVHASVRSKVTMDVHLTTPPEERTPGVPMPIVASVTDTGPITGALVLALIESPTFSPYFLWLHDDGNHGDGAANDGIYANTFHQTGGPGSYNVTVFAWGSSPISGDFHREKILSFYLHSEGDRDNDGLPDEWEIRYGTNPDVSDADQDPDNDGKTNAEERDQGTDPLDSDSDDGGESDGTDSNPLDPADDGIEPTWAVAYPGIGKVFVKYAVRPEYVVMGLFRGNNLSGPFTFYDQDVAVTGLYIDTGVVNGNTYCYIVLGQDTDGQQSAPLMPTCATPKEDPYPPHGWVLINDGAPSTPSPNVMLTLWASDEVDPESIAPGDEVFLPPSDSATEVTEMMISNQPDLSDGTWEPYVATKPWTLAQTSGLAAVFVKYRDAAGNVSDIATATIHFGEGPGFVRIYLPLVVRNY